MNPNLQQELITIIQAFASNTKIEDAFLYGSWAYGKPKSDSDLDIYLVIPDSDVDIKTNKHETGPHSELWRRNNDRWYRQNRK